MNVKTVLHLCLSHLSSSWSSWNRHSPGAAGSNPHSCGTLDVEEWKHASASRLLRLLSRWCSCGQRRLWRYVRCILWKFSWSCLAWRSRYLWCCHWWGIHPNNQRVLQVIMAEHMAVSYLPVSLTQFSGSFFVHLMSWKKKVTFWRTRTDNGYRLVHRDMRNFLKVMLLMQPPAYFSLCYLNLDFSTNSLHRLKDIVNITTAFKNCCCIFNNYIYWTRWVYMIVMVSHQMNTIYSFHSLPASNCLIWGFKQSEQQVLRQNVVSWGTNNATC